MPFSKRPLTWNEEVFAGLAILALIILGIVSWYFYQHGREAVPEFSLEKPISEMTLEEIEALAQTQPGGTVTAEEKMEILSELPLTEETTTDEEKLQFLEQLEAGE